jgi:hypothetical protein
MKMRKEKLSGRVKDEGEFSSEDGGTIHVP